MNTMPSLGMGTFRLEGNVAFNSVKMALEAGYRHIDTAQIYGNEAEVGDGIKASGIPREEIFLTTKVWLDNLSKETFLESVQKSLDHLKTDYVDLLLIHWPEKAGEVPMEEYLSELIKSQELGLSRHVGVSNFTNAQLDQAIEILGQDNIFTNQVEIHPYLQNRAVIEHCNKRGIHITGFMPLAVGKVMQDDVIKTIADEHNANPAQVAIAWQLQQGLTTIPSSTKMVNLESNLKSVEVTLTEENMAAIAKLDAGERIADPDFAPEWD